MWYTVRGPTRVNRTADKLASFSSEVEPNAFLRVVAPEESQGRSFVGPALAIGNLETLLKNVHHDSALCS